MNTTASAVINETTTPEIDTTSTPVNETSLEIGYRYGLIVIYAVVLVTGTVSLSLTMHMLKSSSTSIASVAIVNLIFAHFVFLFTVPFRIYYYALYKWYLGPWWCNMVSAMIHIHMYMSFLFYVVILIMRLRSFFYQNENADSLHRIHAVIFSVLLWMVLLVIVPCVTTFYYGGDQRENDTCFTFGKNIQHFKEINYIISTLIIVVATVLTVLQANVLRVLYKRHRQGCTSDFGVQQKSLGFALIMLVCFIPYHMFRLYYIGNSTSHNLEDINEVFLGLTTFNCLDMLTFLGRRNCYRCFSMK